MNFTEKQRKQIYLKAAELLASIERNENELIFTPYTTLGCFAIAEVAHMGEPYRVAHSKTIDQIVNENTFPEFFMFRETFEACWLGSGRSEYASVLIQGNELRQTVMLLCHEMCNN
jgi:hypothetical protein